MSSKQQIFSAIKACICLVIIDIFWVKYYMKPRYDRMIKNIQSSDPKYRIFYGLIAYCLMVFGMKTFVLDGNISDYKSLFQRGAEFGFITYGIYDATCAAILKDWDIPLAIQDVLWGSFVFGISACASK